MITIYYNNNEACVIRPTPLISISHTPIRNKLGKLGAVYNITLNGTIIAYEGSPFYTPSGTNYGPTGGPNGSKLFVSQGPNYDDATSSSYKPASEAVSIGKRLDAILTKQNALRELFAIDGQKMEIQPITGDGPRIICYPTVESINFEEGIYTDICRYTINLVANTLLDQDGNVFTDGGIYDSVKTSEDVMISGHGGFVEDCNDSWSIEVDESFGQSYSDNQFIPRAYRITRNITATGRVSYVSSNPTGDVTASGNKPRRIEAWFQAKEFVKKKYLSSNGLNSYPGSNAGATLASGVINLNNYRGYNHIRTENIDTSAGTYSVSETWLVASGSNAIENYNISIQAGIDNAFVQVSIDGTIKGLSDIEASGYVPVSNLTTPYDKARLKYLELSNNGQFGVGSTIYKRANNACNQVLNSQPSTISIGANELNGEITYNLQFNNRPQNVFTGVLAENISINDTYPGDIFAIIPVLGRQNGPVLQYIGGRSEYKRDVGIELVLDYTDIGYGKDRSNLLLRKPSINEPIRTELRNFITSVSPANEPGIVKYFLSPPTESWNPKEGRYSLNLSWTYELNQ